MDTLKKADLSTPFYMFDEAKFAANISAFRRELLRLWPKIKIGYSIKTNYVPGICAIARDLDCFGEAVSTLELELVRHLKFPRGHSIFNGPNKSTSDLRLAISLRSIIHLDSLAQVETVLALPKSLVADARIGLRLNVDLNTATGQTSKIASGGLVPRFGLPEDEVGEAVERLKSASIPIISLHGHASSSDRKPQNYRHISSLLLQTSIKHALEHLEFLDVGGGFSGTLPDIWNVTDAPSYAAYAKEIFAPLHQSEWFRKISPTVVIEPGMSILADCMTYTTSVVSLKSIGDRNIASMDGNYFDVRPTLHQKPLPCRLEDGSTGETGDIYTLVGATCMERDILNQDVRFGRRLAVGDRIEFANVGAYTNVLSPHFINYASPVYCLRKSGTIDEMRRRQTFEDFFTTYTMTRGPSVKGRAIRETRR